MPFVFVVVKKDVPDVFQINKPNNQIPLIVDSPHSGRDYPDDFNYSCDFKTLQSAEDNFVDELFDDAPRHGASFLTANFPRSYIDVNRAVDDIDPAILSEDWPFGTINPTARSDAGIGLIRRLVTKGVPVYDTPLTPKEVQNRINVYYKPYHAALAELIDEAHYHYGHVYHLNCHSMPNATATPKRGFGINPPSDIVLSNRDGATSDGHFIRFLQELCTYKGYRVTLNDPFMGLECITRHGNPARGRHSVQIEINKALYMDEAKGEKHEGFEAFKRDMDDLVAQTAEYVAAQAMPMAAD